MRPKIPKHIITKKQVLLKHLALPRENASVDEKSSVEVYFEWTKEKEEGHEVTFHIDDIEHTSSIP